MDLDNQDSDYDLLIVVKDINQVKSLKNHKWEKKVDLFIYDEDLNYYKYTFWKDQDTNEFLWLVGMLQLEFFTSKSILYKSKDFDVDKYINKSKKKRWKYLERFLNNKWVKKELHELEWTTFNKDYYHICYISSLVDDSEPDWKKIRNIKDYKISIDEIEYMKYCCQKLLNWQKYRKE